MPRGDKHTSLLQSSTDYHIRKVFSTGPGQSKVWPYIIKTFIVRFYNKRVCLIVNTLLIFKVFTIQQRRTMVDSDFQLVVKPNPAKGQ